MDTTVDSIVHAIAGVTGGKAPLHAPEIRGNEWQYVKECLDTEWVSSIGAYVDRLEAMLCEITGASHAVATVSGTAALHICLKLAGVRSDDEVIAPALTFIATANAIAYCGAHPHFADTCPMTLGLDPAKLAEHLEAIAEKRPQGLFNKRTGRRLAAVVCMHTFGHPTDLDGLREVTDAWGLPLVEDAAESLGSRYKGRHTGTDGLLSALSFNGNKIITSGGGGAILTNDSELGAKAKHLTTTAKQPHPWAFSHDEIGYNYRLPNLNAALGCAQLERLDDFLARKRQIAESYFTAFGAIEGVQVVREPSYARSNYWLNALMLDEGLESMRDEVLNATNAAGIMTRPIWDLLHQQPMYRECPRSDLSQAESLARRVISVPSSPRLAR